MFFCDFRSCLIRNLFVFAVIWKLHGVRGEEVGLCWCTGRGTASVKTILFDGHFVFILRLLSIFIPFILSNTNSKVLFVMLFYLFCLK